MEFEYTNDKGEAVKLDVPESIIKQLRGEGYNDGEKKTIDRFTGIINDNETLKGLSGDSKTMRDQLSKFATELTRLQTAATPADDTELTELRTKIAQMEAKIGESEVNAARTVKLESLKSDVRGHLLSKGLGKEYHDDIGYFIEKHFTIEENANGELVFVFNKDKKVFLHEGEPAKALHVSEWFSKEKPSWFQQQKGGLGLNGKTFDNSSMGGKLDIKASVDDLLSSGLKNIKRETAKT